ncbi:MAG: outer membrane beta-barrel protein, partial [Ginsengibacter sp.]
MGGSLGAMNAMTDLGGRRGPGKKSVKDFNLKTTKFAGGLFFGVNFKNAIGLRLEATFGQVHAYDSILKDVAPTTTQRYERNLSFRSNITEIVLVGEFHPFEMFVNYNDDRYPPVVSPYIVAGVGYFHFNPQAKLTNSYIDLQPLHTEGQGFAEYPRAKEYKLYQFNFPVGIGARYDLSPILNIRAEFMYRILMTDYLDDVSGRYIDPTVFTNYLSGTKLNQALLLNDRHKPGAETAHPDGIRGNPKNNDAYLGFSIKLGLTLGRERRR